MISKTCTKCGVSQPVSNFCKNKATKDGLSYQCRSCKAEYQRAYLSNSANRERKNEHQRRWKVKNKGYNRKWRMENLERCNTRRQQYRNEKPKAYLAHAAVYSAIRAGKLVRQPCMICGAIEEVQAHHDSYAAHRRLDVVWLCVRHHRERHASLDHKFEKAA